MNLQISIAAGILIMTGIILVVTNHIRNRLDHDIAYDLAKLKQILEKLDDETK